MDFHSQVNKNTGIKTQWAPRCEGALTYQHLFSPSATLDDLFHVSSCRSRYNGTENWQNLPLLALFTPQKDTKRQTTLELGNPPRVPLTTDGKRASEERDNSSEINSAERLKGRCFIPSGVSSYSLSQAADRSFIEMSAHHTDCNKSYILFQNHNNCMGKTNERTETGKKRESINSHARAPKMCIIYSHDITGEFCCFSFTEGFWNYFCSFPLKESLTWKKKRKKPEDRIKLLSGSSYEGLVDQRNPIILWATSIDSDVVKFRQKAG